MVFGGGHVVLPLLQGEVVPPGWVNNDAFMAGYGAAQAVPGPLFTFAAYLGTVSEATPNGWVGGLICLFGLQSLINIFSSLGLIPTKGMTLPFVSYGGSSMISVALLFGFLLSLTNKKNNTV